MVVVPSWLVKAGFVGPYSPGVYDRLENGPDAFGGPPLGHTRQAPGPQLAMARAGADFAAPQ